MSCFKKIGSSFKSALGKAVDFTQDKAMAALSKKYPDMAEVMGVLDRIKGDSDEEQIDGPEAEDDGRWRPFLLTMGLLYKLQRIEDAGEDHWYNHPDVFVNDDTKESELMHVFGFYWHLCVLVAGVLRSTEIDHADPNAQDRLKAELQEKTAELNLETVLANATDDSLVDQHCPDFAVLLDPDHELIIINICGTRMLPAPKMSDVFMDLCATAEPFLNGRAHRGMAVGARNIMDKIESLLEQTMEDHPDYGILVTGYSLGAGICQLVAMELSETKENVRCISYGAPLVFEAEPEIIEALGQNLYTVVCSHDGLASASLCTASRLLSQVRAIDDLQFRKRDMIKMLMGKVTASDGTEMKEEDDSEDDDDFDKEKLTHKPKIEMTEDWEKIREAVVNVPFDENMVKLTHPSKNIYVFKRRNGGEVITRCFQDGCGQLAENMRLRGAMFSHHMPWSYEGLFDGYGVDQNMVPVDIVKSVLNL